MAITAVVLVLGIFIVEKFWPREYGCEASNFGVGSWTGFDGENYYFAADGNINKLNQDGNVTCLRQNKEGGSLKVSDINLVGDWLFYQKTYVGSPEKKAQAIYKMRLDGTEEQEVKSLVIWRNTALTPMELIYKNCMSIRNKREVGI